MEALLPVENVVTNLYTSLRRAGYKVTQARRAVIESLAQEPGHLTAPDVVQAVQRYAPGVARASVYRTLELMTRLGLMQSSTLGGTAATYVLTPNKHHHHVICTECRKTVEFDDCVMEEIEDRLGERLGFSFEGHLVELYGRCPDCLD
jgi:Fe2+ or Zn2+ uptake regulation protein